MTDKKSLIEFPCNFPVKIIGRNNDDLFKEICGIAKKHFPDTLDDAISAKESGQGNYLAITVIIYAHSQLALDALYLELTQHPDIKWVL
ncbi:YbeD family protein [Legionella jordanis]|uniref:UPF0250 protein Ljor_1525 n=1 Tax=Legionella jordanis TaxID=456 RepID=A0A0W0VAQ9_9GAMM|nr:DUF493 domain-containing protein [Legionella jordanis]KTD17219.1 hypothetical protein Ljor_1525 [Legionella jordanis]RMX03337.1 DUF493 domain-containing protein [Legionella jordanis]RMX15816.1 DUF493 domain-containing protein [Legionella jordanis]VEH12583.1 putative lipoate regulatory protein YbeD [Legionella jordanis]HAT8713343.1 DUF493 family protein [Legionella jordanis]